LFSADRGIAAHAASSCRRASPKLPLGRASLEPVPSALSRQSMYLCSRSESPQVLAQARWIEVVFVVGSMREVRFQVPANFIWRVVGRLLKPQLPGSLPSPQTSFLGRSLTALRTADGTQGAAVYFVSCIYVFCLIAHVLTPCHFNISVRVDTVVVFRGNRRRNTGYLERTPSRSISPWPLHQVTVPRTGGSMGHRRSRAMDSGTSHPSST
jgi:hypothetical protein